MSRYIYTHPWRAYKEEIVTIVKTCTRRNINFWIMKLFMIKALLTYWYRYVRLLAKPK